MDKKPGYKSTTFYLTAAAMFVAALIASGVFPVDSPWAKALVVASSILGAMGYTVTQAFLTVNSDKAKFLMSEATKNPGPFEPPK